MSELKTIDFMFLFLLLLLFLCLELVVGVILYVTCYCTSLTPFGVSQSKTSFTFFSSIFILSSPIITFRNSTSLTFHLHFFGFTYKTFSTNLFTTFSTSFSCPSSLSVLIITSSIKLAIFLVLMRFYKISFIMV